MIKCVATFFAIATFAGSAIAADVVDLTASKGKVSFPHKKHQDMQKDCIKCHEKAPGKIQELGKEWAHKTCNGCHAEMKKGPVECKGCHSSQ